MLGRTPFEAWHGKKPDLSHLCKVGSHAFTLILKHNPKIYEQSFECILIRYSPNSKSYHLYHPSTHCPFESFHVKFIEQKDDVSHPLYPGCVINIPVTDNPTTATSILPTSSLPSSINTSSPISQASSSSPKHTSVQDEEESAAGDSSPVWGTPPNNTEVFVPLPQNPADVIPVHTDDIVPILTADIDTVPCCSAQTQAPSVKAAENLGIKHIPRVAQAIVESCKAGHCLK